MKAILLILVRFVMTAIGFLVVFVAALCAVFAIAVFLGVTPQELQWSSWLSVFVLVSLGVPVGVATFAARFVNGRILSLFRESALPSSVRRIFAIVLMAGYISTAIIGSPTALKTGYNGAIEGYLKGLKENPSNFHPRFAAYAAVPLLPGVILTYEEYQIGMLAGFGGFCLYIWYGNDARNLGSFPFWVS